MPFIVAAIVAVLAADIVVLAELNKEPEATAVQHRLLPQESLVAKADQAEPVKPLGALRRPHLFVVTRKPLTEATLKRIGEIKGLRALELADAATVTIDGKRVQTLGVRPSSFRAYTPKVTAASDSLWANVAAGDVAVSFVLGNDGGLTLGRTVAGPVGDLRIGAYATMGMGAVDAIVSHDKAKELGFPSGNALLVSAPKADIADVRQDLLRVLPKGSQVATMNPTQPPAKLADTQSWPSGAFMSAGQLTAALTAAVGKLGRPYVWGAEGPETFDCSGLVQWAFARAGVRMPRVTHQQWVSGPQVPLAQAQPGDLIFWRSDPTNPGYISHVAIYWGDGKVLQAPRTGDVVKISTLSTRNLAGVVRVSPTTAAAVR